ncbi:bestrophin family protein [Fulvivirga maritima]|uniref:bestrophin family protein n=1 Tax=Fulvivirga maritima TaxID=2904247 RepID=UPI001F414BBD|nr:bestrophin family protein [Fulvivirga maritima]UII26762.1 bestrophin family protein [Fulvivirga maritima]
MILKKNIPISYIISELKTPLISVTLIAIASAILPLIFGSFFSEIPINIATTLGVAISILLSYMINQSYERWWEARKIWGGNCE